VFSEDKDIRLLVLGILMGAGMSALYDLMKYYITSAQLNIPEPFVITGAFVGAVGIMIAIFVYVDWNKKTSKSRKPAETK
jgi:hypothetical protein